MKTIFLLLLVVLIFLATTFLYWKLTYAYAKKEYGAKMFKQWGTKMFYWSGALFFSGGITVGLIYGLKTADVLFF